MNVEALEQIFNFEDTLKPGDLVQVFWTNGGRLLTESATIAKINTCSIRVKLKNGTHGYSPGWEITVPRVTESKWSMTNRVKRHN